MTTQIQIKRGYSTPTGLTAGELAYNVNDSRLYIGNTADQKWIGGEVTGGVDMGGGNAASEARLPTQRGVYEYTRANFVGSVNGATGAITDVARTSLANTFTPVQTFGGGISAAGGITFANDIFVNGARVGIGPAGTDNTVFGVGAGVSLSASGDRNVLIGKNAGDFISTADDNVIVGCDALGASNGGQNVAIGSQALEFDTVANSNVAIGWRALRMMGAAGSQANVAIGVNANSGSGQAVSHTVAIGTNSALINRTNDIVAIGSEALDANSIGTANVAVGRSALGAATTSVTAITTTAGGSGGVNNTYTGVTLERDSGGIMATYPTVTIAVSGGAVVGGVTLETGGVGSSTTTAGGIIFRPTSAAIARGIPSDWRCQLQTVATGIDNTAVGHNAGLLQTSASNNTLVGARSGDAITSGSANVAVGRDALGANTTGSNLVAIGTNALNSLQTANNSVGIGSNAGFHNIDGYNVAVGTSALQSATKDGNHVAIGHLALSSLNTSVRTVTTLNAGTGGSDGLKTNIQLERVSGGVMATYPTVNLTVSGGSVSGTVTIIGTGSRSSVNIGGEIVFKANAAGIAAGVPADWTCQADSFWRTIGSTAVGAYAGRFNLSGQSGLSPEPNTFIGSFSGENVDRGACNTFVGEQSGRNVTTGSGNTYIGNRAGQGATPTNTGGNNVAIGGASLRNIQSGSNNIAIGGGSPSNSGNGAGPTLTTGSGNVIIGRGADVNAGNVSNCIVISGFTGGGFNTGDGSNTTVIGNSNTTSTRVFGTLSTNGGVCAAGGTFGSGVVFLGGISAAGSTFTGATNFTNGVTVGGRLDAGGVLDVVGGVTLESTLDVVGAARFVGGLSAAGGVTLSGALSGTTASFSGNVTLTNGNLILGTAGKGIDFSSTGDSSFAAVAATGLIRRTATNVSDGDTVTIGTTVYTFKATALTPADYEVLIGADASASLTNLRHAILGTGGTPGTDYQVPAAHPTVTAGTITGTDIPLTAITAGTAGNSIALAETSAELSVSAVFLRGGAAAGGTTSEVLDDYEEGTFLARFASTGGTLHCVPDGVVGWYVKVGRLVTVSFYLGTNSADASAATGDIKIVGLPFVCRAGFTSGGVSFFSQAWASSTTHPSLALIANNTAELSLRVRVSADAGVSFCPVANFNTGTTTSAFNQTMATIQYVTDT